MRFIKGGLNFGMVTHVDGATFRKKVKDAVVSYKRSRRVVPVFLTHMEPVRVGTLHLPQ